MAYQSGVYLIVNTVNGMTYVGSTRDAQTRFATHKRELRKGTHHNSLLQSDWIEHGENAFTFQLIEPIDVKEHRVLREQHWMDTVGQSQKLYNVQRVAVVHGRKPEGEEAMIVTTIMMMPSQKEAYLRLGGAAWLRKAIDDAPEPEANSE